MYFKNWLLYENYDYSCVMAMISNPTKIINWSKNYIDEKVLTEDGLDKEPHITLLYGLHTNDFKNVLPMLNKIKPFIVEFGKISKFESENLDVLKINVKSPILQKINRELKKLPYTNYLKYIPHCTLAYVKRNSCDYLCGRSDLQGPESIDKIAFSPSVGSKFIIDLK